MTVTLLLPDVHVFERGWLSSNNIFFDDGTTSWLVDSGYSTHSAQTLALVHEKLQNRTLDILINSHLHSDHCGGNAALQDKYSSLLTLIPPGQADLVQNWDTAALTYDSTGQQCPKFGYTGLLSPGSSIRLGSQMWDIYAAPGHDPDAILLFEPDHRILISGDALWENGFGVVFPELEGAHAFGQVGTTLDVIERLNPNVVIPGHGQMFYYTSQTVAIARQRLRAFIQNPAKHARHAIKVLLKFKLLEVQQQSFDEFSQWASRTPYLLMCKSRFFDQMNFAGFLEEMCLDLVKSGAARMDGRFIHNA